MLKKVVTNHSEAFLAQYRIPPLSFVARGPMPETLLPIWEALNIGNPALAQARATHALEEKRLFSTNERAALKTALAAAELYIGSAEDAKRRAGRALDLFPHQWMAHRILLTILSTHRDYMAAYMHLSNLDLAGVLPVWDEPMEPIEIELALASWSWLLGEWENVVMHLNRAYPGGLATMPQPLQEDWFKLSLYRGRPEDAAAAAAILIADRTVELADELLQTIVQNGWTKQALPLYRSAYDRAPKSQLLRRRLVALCIREGALDEARELTTPGALSLAA